MSTKSGVPYSTFLTVDCSQQLDMMEMIGSCRGDDTLDNDPMSELNERLLCKSYEEYAEKYNPKIYSFFDVSSQQMHYIQKEAENIADWLDCIKSLKEG